ncbi:17703_t:CDS:2 [Acaulospora morrowiae]|uniref:17703_t:CDS:1 n=1 Tax=Acaulospora morrowiae TaxID=94023 RepID=A0A9N9ECA6_9GLOM|nr:17703_t:CDS:2 [Acaulospora morrowiae]
MNHTSSTIHEASQPWSEKYRPRSLDDISAQEETVAVLRKTIVSQNLPHMLFYGPPGTGKTSTILAIARELYGPENMKIRVKELNASDDRGIDVIRQKVKKFARNTIGNPISDGYSCPPYKIIILDEADSMTHEAQAALRRLMEDYSTTTRFCIICNYVTRIIEPIVSRCAQFRFKSLDNFSAKSRLQMICDKERVIYEPEVLDELVKVANGDMRMAIMYLQTAYSVYKDEVITTKFFIPDAVIEELIQSAQSHSFNNIEKAVSHFILSGYSAVQLLSQIQDHIVYDNDNRFSNIQKANMAICIGEMDKCLADGCDEHLQILNLIATISKNILFSEEMITD